MDLLRNQAEWEAWVADNLCTDAGDIADPPREFPCYARTVVTSWQNEEETAVYLYRDDIKRMHEEMQTC